MADKHSKGGLASEEGRTKRLSSFVHVTDLILACAILAACWFLYDTASDFEDVPDAMAQSGVIPPEWFPQLLIMVIAVLTLIIPFEHIFHEDGKEGLDSDRKTKIRPIAVYSALLLCAVVWLMSWLGMFVSMVLACVLMPPLWGETRWKAIAIFAVVFPGAVALLFTQVLGVYFEPGILAKLF